MSRHSRRCPDKPPIDGEIVASDREGRPSSLLRIRASCGVLNFPIGWFTALRWQRLPQMEQLGDFLLEYINGAISNRICVKGGFALHCSKPPATR